MGPTTPPPSPHLTCEWQDKASRTPSLMSHQSQRNFFVKPKKKKKLNFLFFWKKGKTVKSFQLKKERKKWQEWIWDWGPRHIILTSKAFSLNWGHKPLSQVVKCHQGILKGEVSLYCWPPVWLVWNQLYDNWQFLISFAKQTNPDQSTRRSMVQWYFPL